MSRPFTSSNVIALPAAQRGIADRRQLQTLAVMLAIVAAVLVTTRVNAQGQKYDSVPMHQALDEAMIKRVESTTKSFMSSGNGDARMVTAYFRLYVPAMLTAPDGASEMGAVVKDVSNYIDRAARTNRVETFQKATSELFAGLKPVTEGNYHPSARIAAITLMSRLDQQQANNITKTPPVPLMAALPVLMKLYEDEKNVDGIRAAALQGMQRHVSLNFSRIPADARTQIVGDMTKLLESPAPAGRDTDVHAFLQRYAVDILTLLRANNDAALGEKLISISTKPNTSSLIALHSAAKIGQLGKELKGKVGEPDKVLSRWSAMALKAFESEVARLNGLERVSQAAKQPKQPSEFLNKTPNRTVVQPGYDGSGMADMGADYDMDDMGADYSMAGMGDDFGDEYGMDMGDGRYGMPGIPEAEPQPPEVIASRRRLNHVLQQLHLGVTGNPSGGVPSRNPGGLIISVDENGKKLVTDWVTKMEEVLAVLNDKMLDDRKKYLEGIEGQIEVLRGIVGEPAEPIFSEDDDIAEAAAPAMPADALVGAN